MANQKELADHLDLTARMVRNLISSGILPSSKGNGGYDLDSCRTAYIRYLRGVRSGQVEKKENTPIEEDDYRELLEQEKWREKKRENDLAEKLIAPVSLITLVLTKAAAVANPILDGIVPALKRNNPELTGPDLQIVGEAIAKARNAIASATIEIE